MSFLQNALLSIKYGEPVIVVSGLPRSGTSMTMKMLEAAGVPLLVDGIRTADEDNPKGYYELERVKDLDKDPDKGWVADARGKVVKIISFLLKDLPDTSRYQVIFMVRSLDEVLASQQKMLDRRGEENETDDARMKEVYEKHLAQVRRMIATKPNFECLEVPHREVLTDPRGQAKRIAEFLGGKLSVDKMAAVVDDSLYRNRA